MSAVNRPTPLGVEGVGRSQILTILRNASAHQYPKTPNSRFGKNLVKGVKPPNSFQLTDSDGNINFKSWRVYPLQFAGLEVEDKNNGRDRKSGSRLFYWN
jgi:hypothetical protein